MGIRHEISQMVMGMSKRAQAPGYFPIPEEHAEMVNKGVFKAPIAGAGAVIGGVLGAADGVKQNGAASLVGGGNAGDTWRQIGNGMRIGAKTGWNEATRTYSDLAATGAQVAHDFGLMSDDQLTKIKYWNDDQLLASIRRAGVPMPPDEEMQKYVDPKTNLLLPTGNPEYSEYDRFVNWARYGQLAGRIGLGIGAFAYGGKALGAGASSAARALGAGSKATGWAGRVGSLTPLGASTVAIGRDRAADGAYERDVEAVRLFNDAIERLGKEDPSTPEYAEKYRKYAKWHEKYPLDSFRQLKPPTDAM